MNAISYTSRRQRYSNKRRVKFKTKTIGRNWNMPIIWHIMKFYASYGIKEFILCVGYKGNLIKEFFYNYNLHTSDLTINLKNNTKKFYKTKKMTGKLQL